ncbi:SusC/RagA family TonB-linked outer membrane protein [Prevotella salivae]|uniref:SusC/RagA family TonB-linked outer membrane protein n=1 Tax=Segatella salivae TaxID=228604 RepID=A0AAW4NSU1_9BACT|nr:SusC/RagA family TonB-linked outer membrane protein [Segatella salivae]MBW4866825.1 SusC/RagA family TonB-linked outer membrane protein [Segatella salivae]MBW4907850.1 SusC/RagA family TonB-linked outer membrane protein [Segatella salivae]MBW4910744.1 SusC/RagA family TonB-linked outer membrane protein [Segatella salivae]
MEKRLFMFLAGLFLSIGMAVAQTQVTGTVVSGEDGEPIVGASVKVSGTKTGTITDVDGKFALNVPEGTKLVVTYLGMLPKTVNASVSGAMKIKLDPDNKVLDEVVVTAMGITREKKALGYASQVLDAKDLNTSGTSSLASAMQGKLTGVDIRTSSGAPGASAQIVIRGARSFDGNNTPLYVVDGMPISSTPDFSTKESVSGADNASRTIDLNPDDIESINVLKGQAASALYGIRASNGVILITTKRGSKGSTKPVITFSTDLSAQTLSRKFEHQDVYAQGTTLSKYNPNTSMSWGPKIADLANDATYGGNTNNKYTNGDLTSHAGMYYNPKYAAAGLSGWATPQTHDNVGDFFKTGFTQNSTFNISQRKNDVSYSFSVSDTYQKGVIPSTGMTRTGARGAVDWKVNDQWKTGFSANYSSVKIKSAPGANSGIVNVVYSAPAEYDLKGTPYHKPGDPTSQILFRATNFNNPYWWADNDEYSQHTNRVFGNAYAEFSPKLNWGKNYKIVFREQAGIDMYTSNNSEIAEVGSAKNTKGEVENIGTQNNIFNNLLTANFTAKWGANEEWDFGFVLGNEFNHQYRRKWDYDGTGLAFYGQPTIGNTSSMDAHSDYHIQERTVGIFGQMSLSWMDMLFLTVTGRNDVVSTMPRGNRSFFYPSVSLGWIFTELPALKENHVLSYGKLRLSYAQVGQAGQFYNNYMYVPSYTGGMYVYTPISYPLGGAKGYAPYYVKFDENLKPQNTSNWETGIDLGLFKNRVRVEYTLSYQDVRNQIFDVPTAGTTGYQALRTNAGQMTTLSHELSVNASVIDHANYGLDLGVNFTKITNKVKKLADGVESIMLGGFVEPQVRAQAGYTYPNIYGKAFKRTEDGQLLLNANGLPQGTAASVNLGECTPDFNMGFNLRAHYKQLSLSATMDWQKGGCMYNGTLLTMNYFGASKASLPYHEGTMVAEGINEATGQKNTVQVSKQQYYMAYNDVTEAGIFDTSFLKLRDVTLSYQFPKFAGINLSVYGFARNILLWAKLPGLDPESSQGNGNMSGYFERYSIPNSSSFGGGFKIAF